MINVYCHPVCGVIPIPAKVFEDARSMGGSLTDKRTRGARYLQRWADKESKEILSKELTKVMQNTHNL